MSRVAASRWCVVVLGCVLMVSACVSNGSEATPTSTTHASQGEDSSTPGEAQRTDNEGAQTSTSYTDGDTAESDEVLEVLEPFDGFGWGSVVTADADGESFDVLIASTEDQRRQGLMFVDDLEGWDGMWFVFDEPTSGAFWMYNTLMDLSIAWIDGDGVVVAVAEMVPCVERPCPVYSPGTDYTAALEVVG